MSELKIVAFGLLSKQLAHKYLNKRYVKVVFLIEHLLIALDVLLDLFKIFEFFIDVLANFLIVVLVLQDLVTLALKIYIHGWLGASLGTLVPKIAVDLIDQVQISLGVPLLNMPLAFIFALHHLDLPVA